MLTFNSTVREVATALSYGREPENCAAHLVARGMSQEDAFLMVMAAQVYLRAQEAEVEQPKEEVA
jgi:hypothetical protein